jgi:cytochrome c
MDFLNNLFLPPSADHLHLVHFLILVIYFIHIPFISLLLGGTFFSVFFRILAGNRQDSRHWRVSRDFIDTLVFRKTAGIFLGVLPLLILTLIEGQVFYDANIAAVRFLIYATLLIAVGISLVYLYQYTFRMAEVNPLLQLSSGLVALFFLVLGYFIFSVNSALILDPGRWAVVNRISKILFSWNVIARFLNFLTAAGAVSGIAMVFFFFNWNESRQDLDPDYSNYMLKLGGGIGIGFTLLQPLFIFWNLITLPDPALSTLVFVLTIFALVVILVIALLLYRMLSKSRSYLGTHVFVLFIIAFVVMIVNDHEARESAIHNHTRLLTTRAEEVAAEIESKREAEREASVEPDVQLGESVYKNQCSSCHRFDQKLVGPPYNETLPKFRDKKKELADFIRSPYKIDPAYPAMPKLGLSEKEIKSVIAYLYQELDREKQQ